ncbi:uncharacterized protein SPPG_09164 [Spizellomyces punctatus DAOM BR117]|uniref:Uncharacterized protein n=1 Tax=Spizellomyces punctatus (strain DAOM BR117) TaxID=645134 RepID=A0A0L0HH99_SPIPD|nr:uncharacterized protein SPPG_09164 [Spizellomyces punctatus DAOM BR117]KND00841.1 hypothetical protein SPPG_09164 [Spizellomyces punctatus DAOM BR117]|eukprot:XP_016608880.1 hypothetical protein SPPG_09164 [Spizellomyces punctatus DAOM BR117]
MPSVYGLQCSNGCSHRLWARDMRSLQQKARSLSRLQKMVGIDLHGAHKRCEENLLVVLVAGGAGSCGVRQWERQWERQMLLTQSRHISKIRPPAQVAVGKIIDVSGRGVQERAICKAQAQRP